MTIKELTVEFEGEQEEAQLVQIGLNRVFDGLMDTQNRLLEIEDADYQEVEALPTPNGNVKTDKTSKSKQAKRRSPRDNTRMEKIQSLKDEGYFSEKRAVGDIRDALKNKGFNFESSQIASTMQYLTKKNEFQREQQDGNFVYWSNSA